MTADGGSRLAQRALLKPLREDRESCKGMCLQGPGIATLERKGQAGQPGIQEEGTLDTSVAIGWYSSNPMCTGEAQSPGQDGTGVCRRGVQVDTTMRSYSKAPRAHASCDHITKGLSPGLWGAFYTGKAFASDKSRVITAKPPSHWGQASLQARPCLLKGVDELAK